MTGVVQIISPDHVSSHFQIQSRIHSGKLTWLAGKSPFSIGNTSSSQRVHFPASHVSLPEISLAEGTKPKFQSAPARCLGVSKNRGTPKSSILIGFSIMNHPFWGTPIFGNIHLSFPIHQTCAKDAKSSIVRP